MTRMTVLQEAKEPDAETRIYLDNNATTTLDPRVLEAIAVPLQVPLNPSSVHSFGQQARNLLTKARRSVAHSLGVTSQEVIFTSGGTESINLALRGILSVRPGHVITSSAEHVCVHATLDAIGCPVTRLNPGPHGAVCIQQVLKAIRSDTTLIVLMAANNETGVITDLQGIADHTDLSLVVDGTAALGKGPLALPPHTVCAFSGHKIHGPKGSGLLIVPRGTPLAPQITGGPQQFERRSGTENLPAMIGLARAIELIEPAHWEQMRRLRDQLEAGLLALHPTASINGTGPRVANVTNISFAGIDGESLLMNLDLAGIAVSHGSACSSGSLEPSHVLLGMGLDPARARSSLRFSLSRFTTSNDICYTLETLRNVLAHLSVA